MRARYVNGISSILSSSIPVLGTLLSPTYFQYFLDKVSSVFTISVIAKTSHIVPSFVITYCLSAWSVNLFVLIQLAASLGPRFYLNIYKCKHISETGAQQVHVKYQANFILFTTHSDISHCFAFCPQDAFGHPSSKDYSPRHPSSWKTGNLNLNSCLCQILSQLYACLILSSSLSGLILLFHVLLSLE